VPSALSAVKSFFSGYDSHRDDCGKGITDWTDREFQHLTRLVLDLAQKASCPVLSCHGGGYQLPITVSAAIGHIKVLAS
jgi:acetoin utilization deacetylase AcuC-like enzyme